MVTRREGLLAPHSAEEHHVGLVVDVEERAHRDGAEGEDDDRRKREVDGGEVEEILGRQDGADSPDPMTRAPEFSTRSWRGRRKTEYAAAATRRTSNTATTRPVTGPRMSSTTLFAEKGSVTTTLRATNAVRKNAIRNRRRRARRSTSSPRRSSELIARG